MTIVARNNQAATKYRVIFGDTDAAGIVYHPRYLELAERGRNEIMRQLGLNVGDLFAKDGFGLAIRSCSLKFLAPARFDDVLLIRTNIDKLKAASATWTSSIKRGPEDICQVTTEIVCMDRFNHQSALFPDKVMAAFKAAEDLKKSTKTELIP